MILIIKAFWIIQLIFLMMKPLIPEKKQLDFYQKSILRRKMIDSKIETLRKKKLIKEDKEVCDIF